MFLLLLITTVLVQSAAKPWMLPWHYISLCIVQNPWVCAIFSTVARRIYTYPSFISASRTIYLVTMILCGFLDHFSYEWRGGDSDSESDIRYWVFLGKER